MSDFIIVGAGVMGLLLSRRLAKEGAKVTLLERQEAGQEASWAGGGIVSPLYPWTYEAPVTALANNAQEAYRSLSAELLEATGIDPEYNPCGLLMLDRADSGTALDWARKNGLPMQALDKPAVYRHCPVLGGGFASGLYMPYVGNVRNPRLLKALITDVKGNPSINFVENAGECLPVLEDGGRAYVRYSGESISAGKVVFTTGAWTGKVLGQLGKGNGIEPVHGQMLVFEPGEPMLASIILHEGRYLIPRKDGRVLVGSTLEYQGFKKTQTPEARNLLLECAQKMLPGLATRQVEKHWSGLRPGSPGGIPKMGKVQDTENLYVCAGHFRNGLVLAPASVEFMFELLSRGETTLDGAPYALA